ncbi:MAG: hypothetical protein ABJN14_02340 [Paracoccaceae bacterium]
MTAKLATYQNYARTSIARAVPWRRSDCIDLQVEIVGGVHDGSVTTIDTTRLVIGPAVTDDIMLLDESAAGENVTIETESSVFGPMVSVHSPRTDVSVNGVTIGSKDSLQTFRLPCQLQINDIPITLTADTSKQTCGLRSLEVGAILLLSWVCLFAVGYALNWGQPTESSFVFVGSDEKMGPAQVTPIAAPPDPAQVTAMIQEAGLGDYLRVVPKSAEALAVTGTLPDDLKDQWLSVRRQIDSSSKRLVVFSEFDESPSRPTIPAIASVRFGDDPALIFSNNRSARVGDTLGGGWTIAAITETGFDLTRQGKELSITY